MHSDGADCRAGVTRSGSTSPNGGGRRLRCSASDGTISEPPNQISTDSTTSSTNGAAQLKCAPSITPAGTPAIAASENAVMIVPVAAPRRCTGITSPTIAMITEPSTPPRDAGKRARRKQQRVAAGERTGQIGQREQRIDGQQQLAPVETVDVGGGEQARQPRTPRVGRHRGRERGRRDAEGVHDLRAQRHHDHEVHDDGELRQREQP